MSYHLLCNLVTSIRKYCKIIGYINDGDLTCLSVSEVFILCLFYQSSSIIDACQEYQLALARLQNFKSGDTMYININYIHREL